MQIFTNKAPGGYAANDGVGGLLLLCVLPATECMACLGRLQKRWQRLLLRVLPTTDCRESLGGLQKRWQWLLQRLLGRRGGGGGQSTLQCSPCQCLHLALLPTQGHRQAQ